MSKIEVNTVEPQCGTTLTVGKCTTSVAVPGNVVKSNALQASDGGNIVSQSGTTITLGASGDTVALASGASQTGFGRSGSVNWNTTKITADPANAVSGTGYFCDTSGGAFTVTLPTSPSAGDIVAVSDYTRTWNSNNLTIGRNSKLIGGIAGDAELSVNGQSATFVFVDDTEGWINTQETQTSQTGFSPYLIASGGNQSPACGIISGDYKTHIFTGPGTFCVSSLSSCAPRNAVDYVIVAGGGGTGGGGDQQGGGGGGGFRMSNSLGLPAPLNSPLANPTGHTIPAATGYPIAIGGGGACGGGNPGYDSTFDTITSTGGGFGIHNTPGAAGPGGSGGGASSPSNSAGNGNDPATPIAQGQPGGPVPARSGPQYGSGGGGGAAAAGGGGSPGGAGSGGGGTFIDDNIIGPTAPSYGTPGPTSNTRYFSGGGGGGQETGGVLGNGGVGGGGSGVCNTGPIACAPGTINTGGGAGSGNDNTPCGGSGGSGILIIRYKFQ